MIYLHRGTDRCACETERTAQLKEAQGWVRCSGDVHRALWQIENVTRIVTLRGTVTEPAPIVAPPQTIGSVASCPQGYVRDGNAYRRTCRCGCYSFTNDGRCRACGLKM